MAKTYSPETKNNEVWNVEDVKVKETDVISVTNTSSFTLNEVDFNITSLDSQIAVLQATKANWVTLRPIIQAEAEKVELKKPEPEPI